MAETGLVIDGIPLTPISPVAQQKQIVRQVVKEELEAFEKRLISKLQHELYAGSKTSTKK
jgi:hypothetical protein